MTELITALLSVPLSDHVTERLLGALLSPGASLDRAELRGRRVLTAAGGLPRLARLSPAELERDLGFTERAGLRLACALELGRRLVRVELPRGRPIVGASDLEPHLRGRFNGVGKEVFVAVLLDAKHRLLRTEQVSVGCLTWSVVHPREVFAPAVREGAGALIVAHNHPSGDPRPSRQDIAVTARLARVGHLLGIPLLDHLVVGDQRVVSLRAEGHLPNPAPWDAWDDDEDDPP